MGKLVAPALVALLLAIVGGIQASDVPVLVWGKPSVTYVPALASYTSDEFAALIESQVDRETFTLVFAEERLSVEDFSQCKVKSRSCFQNLQNIDRKSYLPRVEEPLSVLEGSGAQSVQLLPDGTLSERIVPEGGAIAVVNFAGTDFASHDAVIDAVYRRLQEQHKNIIVIYTGKTPSFSYSSLVRNRRQVEPEPDPEPKILSVAGSFLLAYQKFEYGPAEATEAPELTTVIFNTVEKVATNSSDEEGTLQVNLNGPSANLKFFFLATQGSWEIQGVTFNNVDYYLRNRVHVNQILSYHCNMWDYYTTDLRNKIVFHDVQLQPFWAPTDGTPPEENFATKFGDAWYCVGFTTPGILSGLFLVLIFFIIGTFGLTWMMDIRTMDRFDDPKGKTIIVSAQD